MACNKDFSDKENAQAVQNDTITGYSKQWFGKKHRNLPKTP